MLGRLPESTVEFLTRISVLDRFSGPQCDALLGRLGAARALDALEDSCTFMVALDRHRRVYRFHRLFRDLLRAELDRREPGLAPTLHSRAADWYERHGAAISPSTTGSTRDSSTGRRARRAARPPHRRPRRPLAARALALPPRGRAPARRDAGLAALRAFVEAMRGRSIKAERWLEAATAASRAPARDGIPPVSPWLPLLRSAMCREGAPETLRDARAALATCRAPATLHPAALHVLADAYLLSGDREAAERAYADAAASRPRPDGPRRRELGARGAVAARLRRHEIGTATTLAAKARRSSPPRESATTRPRCSSTPPSARAAAAAGDVRSARIALDHAYEIREASTATLPWAAARARIELVHAYLAAADVTGARRLLPEIESLIRHCPAPRAPDGAARGAALPTSPPAWSSRPAGSRR